VLAPRGWRWAAAYFVVTWDEERVPSFLLSTAARDPDTAALPTIEPTSGVASGR
jgi:hypothetical protein